MGEDYLGEFEHLVMLAILRLGDDAYGAPIRRTIAERAERRVSFGAVYSTLRRLAAKGQVEFDERPAVGEGGGRPRRVYRLTDRGEAVLAAARRRLRRMAQGLEGAVEG